MATYSVTCSNVGSFTYGNRFTLYVKLSNRDGNPVTNKSVVDYEAYFENTSGGGTFSSKTRLYFAINGQVIKDSTGEVTGPRNGKVTIAKGSITVDHNPDGNKSVGFQALVQSTNLGIYGNIENSFALTKIPRYTSITRFAVNKRDETSVTFDYATSDTTDYAWYSKDNGSTWSNLPTNNIVTGLSANTTYNFKLRVRRKDSQLTTDSGTYAQTTYNYPYCTEAPDFVIGNNVTVKFYNPLNRSIQIRMWSHRSAQFVSDLITTSGTSYTGFSNIASNLYASIPNHTNSRYNIDVHYGSNKAIKEGGNYRTVGNEAPSFYNFTYRDTDAGTTALTGNNQTIVKGYSNVEAIVSTANKATPKNSASMSKYRLSIGEATAEVAYSSSAQVATTIANVSSNSFTMYAIDSRGYSTAKTITAATYINYSPIKITSISLTRTNSVTEETTLRFSGTIWNGNFGKTSNAVTDCYYRFRETTSDQWFVLTKNDMNITPTQNGDWFSFTGKIKGDLGATGFDMDNSYIVQIFIADKLSNNYNNPATFTLGPGTPAIAIYKNNVAIGQRYDTNDSSNKLQVNGNSKIKGNSNVTGNSTVAGQMKALNVNSYFLGVKTPACWAYIGNFKFNGQGSYAVIDCYMGDGQNGNAYQNTHARILLKQGWSGESLPIGVTTNFTQNYYSSIKVKISHVSKEECKLYIYLPFGYSDLTCVINGSYKTFTSSMTTSTTTPTTDKESTYYKPSSALDAYPIGSVYMNWTHSKTPAELFGGTWVQMTGGFLYGSTVTATTGAGSTGNGTGTTTVSHAITEAQMPSHRHKGLLWNGVEVITLNEGSGGGYNLKYGGGNNYQNDAVQTALTGSGQGHSHGVPYMAVMIWRRTA